MEKENHKLRMRVYGVFAALIVLIMVVSSVSRPSLPSPSVSPSELSMQQVSAATAAPSLQPTPAPPAVVPVEAISGEQISLAEVIPPALKGAGTLSYQSSNESVVMIDGNGLMTVTGPGQASVSVLGGAQPLSVRVTASEPPSMRISADYCQLKPGETAQIGCLTTGAVSGAPLWTSSNEAVVTVTGNGVLTGVSDGAAWVSAAVDGYTDRIAVWVTEHEPSPPLSEPDAPRFINDAGIYRNPSSQAKDEVSILLTGDLMALSSQQRAAKQGDTYNYNSSFNLVRPIFAQSDFVIGNLETCLSYSNPYTVQTKTVQGNPNCNAQATYLDALRYAGYDAVVTANNHCGDAGSIGAYETLQLLDAYQIAHTGTFSRAEQPRFTLADVSGIRVAFLSYTEIINTKSNTLAVPDEDQQLIFNRYSEERLREDIAAAKEAGAEFIVAYNHWGQENTQTVTEKQKEHAQQLADAGVDFIAGSHSHCLQPPAMITAADGRQVPCIFSLGNFVSSMGRDINNDTVILKLDLRRMEDGHIGIDQIGYIPCRVCPEYEGGHHVIVPVSNELNGGGQARFLDSAERRIDKVMDNGVFAKITSTD